ncbi:MAG: hypothetical protein JW795_17865 [Chitinivibrionales bacterium]|nr:hypothetical protein [Chitinivibrionales bacterium]
MYKKYANAKVFPMKRDCQFIFIILFCIVPIVYGESVYEQMERSVTSAESLKEFYLSHTKPYERRYTFQYLPGYLEKYPGLQTSIWMTNAIDSALTSSYTPLVVSAIRCIGELRMNSFADKLTEIFRHAPQVQNAESFSVREAVLESLRHFSDAEIEKSLLPMLKSYSVNQMLNSPFTKLVGMTIRYGNRNHLEELKRFEICAAKEMKSLSRGENVPNKYDEIYPLLKKARVLLSVKGDPHE